jgi:hypothetical protein
MSLKNFWKKRHKQKKGAGGEGRIPASQEKLVLKSAQYSDVVLHHVGYNSAPKFPITYGYARSMLVLHKPWSAENPLKFEEQRGKEGADIEEFKEFLNDVRFPPCERSRFMAAKNWYNKVQRNIECTTKAVPHTSPVDGCDPQTREIIDGHRCYGVPEDVYEKLPFGLDFDWSKDALPVSFCVCPLPA